MNHASQSNEQNDGPVSPEPILQMAFSFAPERVLHATLTLNVYSHIAGGHHSAADIAGAAEASERGMKMLLDAAAVFGLINKQGDSYDLTPMAQTFLVRESPAYIGAMIEDPTLWNMWADLAECVKRGEGGWQVQEQHAAESFFPTLIKSLHVLGYMPAQRMTQMLKLPSGAHVLDVACGSAAWSIPFAEADSAARLTLQDYPGVLEHTKGYLTRHNVIERCDFLPGNLREVDFGEAQFDAAILGNIVHSEGPEHSQNLFNKLHRALKPGGKIVIVDMIANDDRTGPPFALIFALNMLVASKEGGTYSIAEYTDWLQGAGFSNVETLDVGIHSPLVVATK